MTEGRDDLAGVVPTWDRFRSAWQSGADGAAQRALLTTVCDDVRAGLSDAEEGRALEGLARKLAEAGFAAQSIVAEDAALAALAHGSQRQYAAAVLRAVMLYGRSTAAYYPRVAPPAKRLTAPYRPYAAARLSDYAELAGVPSSLVSPEDLAAQAHSLRENERELARQSFALAVDGDLDMLPSVDLWAYAYCLEDRGVRGDMLAKILERGEPLPRPETILRSELVGAYGDAGRLDEAEAQMEILMGFETSGDSRYSAAWGLVSSSKRLDDWPRARRWAERIVKEFPTSPVAPLATRLLQETAK